MKYIKYLIYVIAIPLLWSCDSDELDEIRAFNESEIISPELSSMDAIVIDQEGYDAEETATFSWEPANFGCNAAVSYAIYMSSEAFPDFALASAINATSFTIDFQSLYNKLVGEDYLALPGEEIAVIPTYISATIGSDFTVVKSASVDITIDIGKIGTAGDLLYIAGDFNDWSSSGVSISGAEKVYAGYADMNTQASSITYKFVDWIYSTTGWGDWIGGSFDALSTTGDNLTTTPGMKYFNVDLNTMTGSEMNFTKVGLTGFNGSWGTPSLEMEYDYENSYYFVIAEATSTAEFRLLCYSPDDEGWGWSYTMGPNNPDDLALSDGSDVKVYDCNSVSKPALGYDPNMKLGEVGTYKFILDFVATSGTWHFRVEKQ